MTKMQSVVRREIAPIHFAVYFFAGVATVLLGPALPVLTRHWRISDTQAGFLFTVLFSGAIAGSIVSTYRPRACYWVGCGFCALALASIGYAPWILGYTLFFLEGMGLGMIINAGNQFVTRVANASGQSGTGALAKVHFAWGVGALSCPWVLRTVFQASRSSILFTLIGIAFAVLAVGLFITNYDETSEARPPEMRERMTMPFSIQVNFAAALILYAGTENAISGWLPSYALRMYGEQAMMSSGGVAPVSSLSTLVLTLLWAAHLLGRALTPVVVEFIRESSLFAGTLVSLFFSLILLVTVPGHFNDRGVLLCIAAVACGLSLAAIYPLMMANLLRQAGNPRGIGWVLASGGIGGAALPWISGFASSRLGTIRAAFYVPCVATGLLLLFQSHLYPERPHAKDA